MKGDARRTEEGVLEKAKDTRATLDGASERGKDSLAMKAADVEVVTKAGRETMRGKRLTCCS